MRYSLRLLLLIILSFVAAIFLALLPLPQWANWFRPQWILLVLIYWLLVAPVWLSVGCAWLLGLIVDLIFGATIGLHALAFLVIAYMVVKLRARLQLYNLIHQCYFVVGFVIIYQAIIFCIYGLMGNLPDTVFYWMPLLTSGLIWPWLYLLFNESLHKYKIKVDGV